MNTGWPTHTKKLYDVALDGMIYEGMSVLHLCFGRARSVVYKVQIR